MNRLELSKKYAKGNGLEIAPFHNPWPTNPGIESMFYIDLFTNDQLREQYPEHKDDKLCRIDAIEDGQFCKKLGDDSFDFVFSSHVLEHCPQVIETVRNWLRVVKNGGHVIMAIPLMHNPIDKNRSPTTWQHVYDEFKSDRWVDNYYDHYIEYHCHVDGLINEELRERASLSVSTFPHIHFHCWDLTGLKSLFDNMEKSFGRFKIVEFIEAGHEVFVVLEKLVDGDLKWK